VRLRLGVETGQRQGKGDEGLEAPITREVTEIETFHHSGTVLPDDLPGETDEASHFDNGACANDPGLLPPLMESTNCLHDSVPTYQTPTAAAERNVLDDGLLEVLAAPFLIGLVERCNESITYLLSRHQDLLVEWNSKASQHQ
jgi:hypothetical protein